MPKNLHHYAGAHALGQNKRSSGVPQVMQPNTAQAGGADQPSEVAIVIARRQGRAKARCKDQAPVLPELNARCEPIGLLLLTPQLRDGPSTKRRTDTIDTRRDRPIFTESSCSA